MKTAYLGEGRKRRAPVVGILLAAIAMMAMPLVAVAQPADVPTLPMDDAPVAAPEAPVATPEAAAPGGEAAAADADESHAEDMASHFSVWAVWEKGDFVAKGTLIIMILMFAGTIYIAATKAVDQTILSNQMKKIPAFWDANTLDEGLDILGKTAAREDATEKHVVTPGPILPAREILASTLLDQGRAVDALREFEAVLVKEPNRLRATRPK